MQSRSAPPDPRILGLRRRVESAFILLFVYVFFLYFLCCMCSDCDAIFRRSVCKREREAEKTKVGEHVQRQTAKRIISNNLVLLHHVSKPSKKGFCGMGKGSKRWSTQSCLSEALGPGPLLSLAELSSMHFKENHYYRCGKRMKKEAETEEKED